MHWLWVLCRAMPERRPCLASFVILLGDTVPLSAIFFDYGVDALSGTKVVDHDMKFVILSYEDG